MRKIAALLPFLLILCAFQKLHAQTFPKFTEDRLQQLLFPSQYPQFEKPTFWIRDIKGEPILGAKIELKFKMPILLGSESADQQLAKAEKPQALLTECTEQGLYPFDSLESAWYHVSIKARGYANVEFDYEHLEGRKSLFRIILCPPNLEPIYLGSDLTFWRPEQQAWTVVSLKNPSSNASQNAAKVKAILDDAQNVAPFKVLTNEGLMAFQWPSADSTQRKLKKYLEGKKEIESVMYSFSPDPFKGNFSSQRFELLIQGNHDTLALRKYFWDFNCKVMYTEIKAAHKSMRVLLTYRGIMHLDYFRRISGYLKNNTAVFYPHGGGYSPPPGMDLEGILLQPAVKPGGK